MRLSRFFLVGVISLFMVSLADIKSVSAAEAKDDKREFKTIIIGNNAEVIVHDNFSTMFFKGIEMTKQPLTSFLGGDADHIILIRFPTQESYDKFTGARDKSRVVYRDKVNGKCWIKTSIIPASPWEVLFPRTVEC